MKALGLKASTTHTSSEDVTLQSGGLADGYNSSARVIA